jgi:hypothetical protein
MSSRGRRQRNRSVPKEIGSIQDKEMRELAIALYENRKAHWDRMLDAPPGIMQQIMDRDRAK